MYFRFRGMLVDHGWLEPAFVQTDILGKIISTGSTPEPDAAYESIDAWILPGALNAHSHAFQYAMAGKAEIFPAGQPDDFWTWREAMYRCAGSLDPDQLEAVATMVYTEMLRRGFTQVAEFHYVHHDGKGNFYQNIAETGIRMVRAAERAGIRITIIPVLYQQGGFGQPPYDLQRRFICSSTDDFIRLYEATSAYALNQVDVQIGWSAHSLRAVDPTALKNIYPQFSSSVPFHIHAAEQKKEVQDCLAWTQKRPVQWLLEELPSLKNVFIVHATHLDDQEVLQLAGSEATVVLCPGTEGNLGDGFFRMTEFSRSGGNWCIGTDSHISLDPMAEFRMIDYRQRLSTNRRDTFPGDPALYMFREAYLSGKRAMGEHQEGFFKVGTYFDAVAYDAQLPVLQNAGPAYRLAALMYTGAMPMGTLVRGRWVVKNGEHCHQAEIANQYRKAVSKLKW
ncbi:MAG: formimidoylglutamate deiminase [Bacteroidetes bacterium]|nr:formimidoylglutamate deiminase [Bacteroidota bacterium]